MSTPADMRECECRNAAGFPIMTAHPGAAITGSYLDASRGKNDALPWVVLSCILGAMSLMGVLLMPSLIDAKVRAGVARAEALAEQARKDSSIAKDMVDIDRAKRKAIEEIKK